MLRFKNSDRTWGTPGARVAHSSASVVKMGANFGCFRAELHISTYPARSWGKPMRTSSLASFIVGLILVLSFPSPNYSQSAQSSAAASSTASIAPAKSDNSVGAIQILYTGKTFGYFRVPDWQGPSALGDGCKDPAHQKDKSDAVGEFEKLLKTEFHPETSQGAILLGTGDNFAPEIEAREFCDPPTGQPGVGKSYQRVGKELFDWDAKSKSWIRSDSPSGVNSHFMIPTDNVANFFLREGYAALVPGKQDFYFGPERIRELARFLATQPIPSTSSTLHSEDQGVQMLGANIVIETKWRTGHTTLPDSENPPWFIPRFPTASDLIGGAAGTDVELKSTGLSDGATVYPWFRGVSFELSGENALDKLMPILNSSAFYLCGADSNMPGNPNAMPKPAKEGPCKLLEKKQGQKQNQFVLDFPWEKDSEDFYTLRAGTNYGLCVVASDAKVKAADGSFTFCERFSVYTPFFQSSGEAPGKKCADLQNPDCYHDPDPYVLLETKDENGIPEDIAIFGVVDPQIGDSVGLLNFQWANTSRPNFKTQTTVQDPAVALKQMLDSFDRRLEEHCYTQEIAEGKRRLVKVLLAQMNFQEAQTLGTRMKQFQVVVSAADPEMATVGNTVTSEWVAPRAGSVRHPMVVSVPEPYFVGGRNPQAVVDIGSLDVHITADETPKWSVVSEHLELGKEQDKKVAKVAAPVFWNAVQSALKRDCLPQGFDTKSQSDQIQILTLCEMRRETGADIALLQQRDFFSDLPAEAGDVKDVNAQQPDNMLQQLLDRIVWKGDFLKLLNVPGSALQQALKQSKSFEAADKSNLSIGQNKNRELVSVGITFDSSHNEYLVDGNRLDPSKLYSIATSDFIGGGDTGYPDLAAAQMRPPSVPTDFENRLETISGVICRALAGDEWTAHCIGPIDRDKYLDEIAAIPSNTGRTNTPSQQLWAWTFFHHPRIVPGDLHNNRQSPDTLQRKMDAAVEYRPIWDLRVAKASFGITTLGHTGTDAQVDSNFGGITTPGVNSHRFSNWASDFQSQLTRNWKHYQIFASPSYTYNVQYKGQSSGSRQTNQVANLGMFDLGFARIWKERGPQHFDLLFTTHFETPLQETFTSFTLKSAAPSVLQFSQPRSYTILYRGGFRWQRRISSIEFGPEAGHQWDAIEGFQFLTNGAITATCLAQSNLSFSTCVTTDSNPKVKNPPTITALSNVAFLQGGKEHAGLYWKINLNVPIYPRISYVWTDTGNWYAVNFGSENTTDTRFLDISQHQLRFTIFPSLSIGPELDLLLYENKSSGTLRGSFLRQDQIMVKAQFGFDLFNLHKKLDQIEYAPSSKSQ